MVYEAWEEVKFVPLHYPIEFDGLVEFFFRKGYGNLLPFYLVFDQIAFASDALMILKL